MQHDSHAALGSSNNCSPLEVIIKNIYAYHVLCKIAVIIIIKKDTAKKEGSGTNMWR